MADITLGRRRAGTRDETRFDAIAWAMAHREVVALGAIVAVAALMRFWALDAKALHHDESLHAMFSWYLYDGHAYKHDPLMHGPFLFHANAAVFFLFGASDYTVRIVPAAFGTALVALPYLLRKQIGMRAVLIMAVLLTISPTLLYVSRFIRDDIYVDTFMFAMTICIWRYLDDQRPGWLYGLAALLALSFASMEITFILVAIILVFVDLMLAVELGKRQPDEKVDDWTVISRTVMLAPLAWLIAALWPVLGKEPFRRDRLPPIGDVLVVVGTMVLPQFAAAIQVLPFVGDVGGYAGVNAVWVSTSSTMTIMVLTLMIASAYIGLLWRPKTWLFVAAFFYIPYFLLFTTFGTNLHGWWTGIWGSLDYWLEQHGVARGSQPIYYYGLMTPLYEYTPLVCAVLGSAWLVLKGDALRRWFVFWLAGIFAGVTLAGEKMPWLEVYIALPLSIVGALIIAQASERFELAGDRWKACAIAAVVTALGVMLIVPSGAIVAGRVAGFALLAGVLVWALMLGSREGLTGLGRGLMTLSLAALLTLSVRTAVTLSYINPDTPVEMAVYTQTSSEIPDLTDRINTIAQASGLGYNLPIIIDTTDGFTWPWAWYLRDYHSVGYIDPLSNPNYQPPPNAVLLISQTNTSAFDATGYTLVPYKHRWWFIEEQYRGLTVSKLMDVLTSPSRLGKIGSYFLHRESPVGHTGSQNAVAYFPDSLSQFDSDRTPARPAPEPAVESDGRIIAGREGSGPGELLQPAGLATDAKGNIWVADGRNARLVEYDSTGHFLRSVGRQGTNGGAFGEPWSVNIDKAGNIYVADTWNYRIQKLDADANFLKTWGQAQSDPKGSPLGLFGPRDIAFAPDGSLWITDTGNKRLIHYSADGDPIGVIDSSVVDLSEPVGLEIDASGRIYVADTWHARIISFDPNGSNQQSFSVPWTSQEVVAKPYFAILTDGRFVVAEPASNSLLLYSATGQPLGRWKTAPDALPIGVAATADGGFVFSDARRDELQIVPASLIPTLFR